MTDLTDFLNVVASAEDWAGFGADDREPEEPVKRFTIDVPVELHRRVRAACARRGLKTSSVLRDLLSANSPRRQNECPVAAVLIRDEAPAAVPVPDSTLPGIGAGTTTSRDLRGESAPSETPRTSRRRLRYANAGSGSNVVLWMAQGPNVQEATRCRWLRPPLDAGRIGRSCCCNGIAGLLQSL
jgi:hypothetical protein